MNMNWLLGVSIAVGSTLVVGCDRQQSQTEPSATLAATPVGSPVRGPHEGAAGAHTHATKLEVTGGMGFVSAMTWHMSYTLKVVDAKSGQPVKDFERVHEKLMHIIVVSRDLSYFAHLHPTYKGNGVFTLPVVLPPNSAGGYKLYADYTPQGGSQEVAQHDLGWGHLKRAPVPIVADKMGKDGWINKHVVAGPEGQFIATPQNQLKADAGPLFMNDGPRYTVALMPMPAKPVAGQDVMLHFQVRDAKGQPIKDLQPYLGAMGHCVVLSSDTKTYLHSHPMEGGGMAGMEHDMDGKKMEGSIDHNDHGLPKSGGPDVMFHTNFPTPGVYKAWGQFKHKGKIITAPFVLSVAGGATAQGAKGGTPVAAQGVVYTCPMHPEVQSRQPGTCPKCGMALVKKS